MSQQPVDKSPSSVVRIIYLLGVVGILVLVFMSARWKRMCEEITADYVEAKQKYHQLSGQEPWNQAKLQELQKAVTKAGTKEGQLCKITFSDDY